MPSLSICKLRTDWSDCSGDWPGMGYCKNLNRLTPHVYQASQGEVSYKLLMAGGGDKQFVIFKESSLRQRAISDWNGNDFLN